MVFSRQTKVQSFLKCNPFSRALPFRIYSHTEHPNFSLHSPTCPSKAILPNHLCNINIVTCQGLLYVQRHFLCTDIREQWIQTFTSRLTLSLILRYQGNSRYPQIFPTQMISYSIEFMSSCRCLHYPSPFLRLVRTNLTKIQVTSNQTEIF